LNRIVAVLLAVLGGAAVAIGMLMLGTGAVAGILWIFVFGDDPWPGWATTALNILIPVAGMFLWAVFSWQIWLRLRPHIEQP
jgi:hypothetical protein